MEFEPQMLSVAPDVSFGSFTVQFEGGVTGVLKPSTIDRGAVVEQYGDTVLRK